MPPTFKKKKKKKKNTCKTVPDSWNLLTQVLLYLFKSMQHQLLESGLISRSSTAQTPLQMHWVLGHIPCWGYGEQQQGKETPHGGQDGEKYPEVADPLRHESCQRRSEYEKDWNDSIDHGHLLNGNSQWLHVEVQVWIQHSHGGRLEEEYQLYPDLKGKHLSWK